MKKVGGLLQQEPGEEVSMDETLQGLLLDFEPASIEHMLPQSLHPKNQTWKVPILGSSLARKVWTPVFFLMMILQSFRMINHDPYIVVVLGKDHPEQSAEGDDLGSFIRLLVLNCLPC